MKSIIIEKTTAGRARLLFNNVEAVEGVEYDLETTTFTIDKTNAFKGVPMDEFTFSIMVDGIKSQNSNTAKINYFPASGIPDPVNVVLENQQLNSEINISDYIPYENSFDRIIISGIEGKGTWQLEDKQLLAGSSYFYYEIFDKLKFISNTPGAQNNYAKLTFSHATHEKVYDDDSIIQINTTSLARLSADETVLSYSEEGMNYKEFNFTLDNQIVSKNFVIHMNVYIQNFIQNSNDSIIINFGGIDYTFSDFSTLIVVNGFNGDTYGSLFFNVKVKIIGNFVPTDHIDLKLKTIDANPALVDTDNNTLIFNL